MVETAILSNRAITRMFETGKKSGIVNFGNALLREHSKIDFFAGGKSFETKNNQRTKQYEAAIDGLIGQLKTPRLFHFLTSKIHNFQANNDRMPDKVFRM